ncbi:SusC/RagA family TonB-linked outer membrane protein [Labilibaculum euxinus]
MEKSVIYAFNRHIINTRKILLKMKLVVLLTFLLSFQLSASVKSQNRVTLELKGVSYEQVLSEFKKQADIIIIYSNDEFDYSRKTDVSFRDLEVVEAVKSLLKGTNLTYKQSEEYIIIKPKQEIQKVSPPQPKDNKKKIIGSVMDSNGVPLPGVNIIVKGTTIGTITNMNGKFVIEVEAEAGNLLQYSFIGYKTVELPIDNNDVFDVEMLEDFSMLDQVIVSGVAMGTEKKKMSVSVAKVSSKDLTNVPQSSVSASLQGKIAGVSVVSGDGSPGSGSSIILRGATSLTGSQSPMILLDGMIMQGSLSDINVDDIESIEVVKGAAASALYGSRAGNGVIVVISKRGASLPDNTTKVTVRNEIGIQKVTNLLDLAEHHPYLLANDWQEVDTYTKYATVNYPTDYVSGYNPNIEGNRILLDNGMMTQPFRLYNDVQNEMFESGVSYTNFISVAAKLNQTNLYLSFENHNNEGILKETGGYDRQSFRINVDHAINSKIRIKASNNLILTENDMPGGGNEAFGRVVMMEPDVNLYQNNADGSPYNFAPNQWNQIVFNPLYELYNKSNVSEKTRFIGTYELSWILADWLSFKASYGIESQDYRRLAYTPKGMYTGIDGDGFSESPGYLDNYTSKIKNQNYRATLSFFDTWGDMEFNARLSYLSEDNHFETAGGYGRDFDFAGMPSFSIISDENMYFRDSYEDIKAENIFAIASFTFKDRYILDGLFRRDGSSLFGSEERWHNYYRVSAAYRISQDVKIPGIDELKIRGAIGTSGQRPVFSLQYETYSTVSGVYQKSTLGNKNLKPSESREIEVGIDMTFLKRFNLEATYSNTETSDQFLKVPLLVHQGGFPYQWKNAGTLETNTFEAMLHVNIINKKNLNWDLRFTFDKTKSEITKLDVPAYRTGPQSSFYIQEGEAYGIMYGRKFVHTLEQMQAQIPDGESITNYALNNEGFVIENGTEGTRNESPILLKDEQDNPITQKIGDINPDFRMGLTSSLSYKDFGFFMLWKWKQGGDVYNSTAQKMVNHNRHPMMDQFGKSPEAMKTIDYYLGLYNSQSINEFWIEDGTYLRLAEASVKYTLKGEKLGRLGKYVESVKFGIIGKNLLTFTNYSGYDPEVTFDGYAFDNTGYPNFTTYSFSVNIEF